MPTNTLSARAFNHDTSGVKRAAKAGPVFIMDRGQPADVLLTIEVYRTLAGGESTMVDLLAMRDGADFGFDQPRLRGPVSRPAGLS